MPKSNYRIGHGYDVHRLEEGADCWIGGIKLEHTKGAVGHSDADVVVHVMCDALLGALNLRDIGFHFSDTDKKYEGIDSKKLLKKVIDMVRKKNYEVKNYLKDHRIFMMTTIMALTFGGNWKIYDPDSIKTSFPSFLKIVKSLGGKIK